MEIDRSNMRKTILDFPKQFQSGLRSAKKTRIEGVFDGLIICGVGGSALPGDILKIWLKDYKIDLPLRIHRNYELPHYADEKHLIICLSYSGNTEETLTCFNLALKKKLKVAAITCGGKLAKLAKKNDVPLALVPAGYQPRMALGFQFAALIKILANSGLIKNEAENLSSLSKSLKPKSLENQGKKIAKKLADKTPLIYSSEKLAPLARIWKIKLNENAKTPAFSNCFPELNHTEMASFTYFGRPTSEKFCVLILRDSADNPRNLKRIALTTEILKNKEVGVDIIEITGKNILHKTFSSILLADWASYYLALQKNIDPTPLKIVEEFKKRL